jgi:hypothetical protein
MNADFALVPRVHCCWDCDDLTPSDVRTQEALFATRWCLATQTTNETIITRCLRFLIKNSTRTDSRFIARMLAGEFKLVPILLEILKQPPLPPSPTNRGEPQYESAVYLTFLSSVCVQFLTSFQLRPQTTFSSQTPSSSSPSCPCTIRRPLQSEFSSPSSLSAPSTLPILPTSSYNLLAPIPSLVTSLLHIIIPRFFT